MWFPEPTVSLSPAAEQDRCDGLLLQFVFHVVPHILDWVEVRGVPWPVHKHDLLSL